MYVGYFMYNLYMCIYVKFLVPVHTCSWDLVCFLTWPALTSFPGCSYLQLLITCSQSHDQPMHHKRVGLGTRVTCSVQKYLSLITNWMGCKQGYSCRRMCQCLSGAVFQVSSSEVMIGIVPTNLSHQKALCTCLNSLIRRFSQKLGQRETLGMRLGLAVEGGISA